jgi:RNA polymerase sigma-70 factor (ECF subfamily)
VNDDEAMVRVAQGDEEAFRLLVLRWEQPVFRFFERMSGSEEEARDLTQETLLRVYAGARRYRAAGRFRSWLFRIAGNLARSRQRRNSVIRWIRFDPALHDEASGGEGADRRLEREETASEVRRALARLPHRQRQALLLRRYEEMGYREIAETMGLTQAAVESLLQRAMANLKRDLAGKGNRR